MLFRLIYEPRREHVLLTRLMSLTLRVGIPLHLALLSWRALRSSLASPFLSSPGARCASLARMSRGVGVVVVRTHTTHAQLSSFFSLQQLRVTLSALSLYQLRALRVRWLLLTPRAHAQLSSSCLLSFKCEKNKINGERRAFQLSLPRAATKARVGGNARAVGGAISRRQHATDSFLGTNTMLRITPWFPLGRWCLEMIKLV